jgi:hypothetical protein
MWVMKKMAMFFKRKKRFMVMSEWRFFVGRNERTLL